MTSPNVVEIPGPGPGCRLGGCEDQGAQALPPRRAPPPRARARGVAPLCPPVTRMLILLLASLGVTTVHSASSNLSGRHVNDV